MKNAGKSAAASSARTPSKSASKDASTLPAPEELMEQYAALVWKTAAACLENPEDIKECVNDTFLEFYLPVSYTHLQLSFFGYLPLTPDHTLTGGEYLDRLLLGILSAYEDLKRSGCLLYTSCTPAALKPAGYSAFCQISRKELLTPPPRKAQAHPRPGNPAWPFSWPHPRQNCRKAAPSGCRSRL